MDTKFCINCGATIPDNSKFCAKCGASQDGNTPQQVTINNYNGYNDSKSSGNSKQVIGSSNPVGFTKAFKLFWHNYVRFGGTSSRSEYWYWQLWQVVPAILSMWLYATAIYPSLINTNGNYTYSQMQFYNNNVVVSINVVLTFVLPIWYLACLIPTISLITRRLRDMGASNVVIILLLIGYLIPIVNLFVGIAVFVMTLMPSVKQNN